MSYYVLYSKDGITRDISDFVSSIQFGGEVQTAVRSLDISVLSGTDTYIPKLGLKNGGILSLFSDDKEVLRTVIFKTGRDNEGNLALTGYTHGIYLTKNKDTSKFVKMKASQIALDICNRFGIPVGEIEDTGIVLDKLILREKTLWDMILIALTETSKQSGITYRVFFSEGKLNICERKKQSVNFMLEEGINLISANSSTSIESNCVLFVEISVFD